MTMTNAEWCIKNGYSFYDLDCNSVEDYGEYDIFVGETCIDTIETYDSPLGAILKWLDMEHVEPILDDAEKRYLSGVIRPFRGRAVFVKKIYHTGYTIDYEQIIIRVKSIATLIADIPLPFFKKGEMYKGMKLNREYTLEELGL